MIVLLIACLLMPLQLPQEETVEEIIARLEESSEQLSSFRAAFHQMEVDEFGDEMEFQGTIEYMRGGNWRMALVEDDPEKPVEEVVSDGRKGWMIRHKTKKVEVTNMSNIRRRAGGISLTGAAEVLRTSYEVTYVGKEELGTGITFHLYCKPIKGAPGADQTIRSLDLWINADQPAPITKITLRQRGGIVNTWELSDIQRNIEINQRIFEYRIPRGYQEIIH